MRIVIINGSPRKNGVTEQILHKMEKILIQRGEEYAGVLKRWE